MMLSVYKDMKGFVNVMFQKGVEYFGFLIRRKNL